MTENRADLLAVVDCETTGLDPVEHHPWEVACLLYDRRARRTVLETVWQLWLPESAIEDAEPVALTIGRFWERRLPPDQLAQPVQFAEDFARMTAGLPIVGANVSFDTERLARLLWRCGEEPAWHYRPVDVEALAVGYLHGHAAGRAGFLACPEDHVAPEAAQRVPWGSTKVAQALGVERSPEGMHTALGDCRWALDIWRAVCEPAQVPAGA